MCIELTSVARKNCVPIVEKYLALEVHYWKAVSLCFPHNRGEVLQMGGQEGPVGGQQPRSPGLLEALKISSEVPRKRRVQSNQVQL